MKRCHLVQRPLAHSELKYLICQAKHGTFGQTTIKQIRYNLLETHFVTCKKINNSTTQYTHSYNPLMHQTIGHSFNDPSLSNIAIEPI